MLVQLVFIISVLSSSARNIDNEIVEFQDYMDSGNQNSSEAHREKRQLFGNDFNQIVQRTINNIQLIQNTLMYGRALTTGFQTVINSTADSSSQPRTVQSALALIARGARDSIYRYFRRMGILQ